MSSLEIMLFQRFAVVVLRIVFLVKISSKIFVSLGILPNVELSKPTAT